MQCFCFKAEGLEDAVAKGKEWDGLETMQWSSGQLQYFYEGE